MENKTTWFVWSVLASIVANVLYGWFGAPLLQSTRLWSTLVPVVINGGIMGILAWLRDKSVQPEFSELHRELAQTKAELVQAIAQVKTDTGKIREELKTAESKLETRMNTSGLPR